MAEKRKINWLNTLFLTITPLVGIIGTVTLCMNGKVAWQTWVLAALLSFLGGLCITAVYHRLFSHKAYQAIWPVRLFFAVVGAGAFEGSILEWCTDHRNHHRYVDTEKDPYNINQGFWYAHIGWLIYLDPSKRDFSNIEDLQKDWVVRFQHRFYVPLAVIFGFVLPMAIGALWGNALAALGVAGALRITFNHHGTFFINSLCHYMGKRTYAPEQTARDNWLTAIFTLGEGYHNYHHKFPLDYRNGIRSYHFDPTKWVIYSLSLIKCTSNLKRISERKILQYRLRAEETKMKAHKPSFVAQTIAPLKETIFTQIEKIEKLEADLVSLKNDKIKYVQGKLDEYKKKLQDYASQIKSAEQELATALKTWKNLSSIKQLQVTA